MTAGLEQAQAYGYTELEADAALQSERYRRFRQYANAKLIHYFFFIIIVGREVTGLSVPIGQKNTYSWATVYPKHTTL
jgi:hypothetical protein